MRKLAHLKQIVCGSVVCAGIAVVVIAQTAFATPVIVSFTVAR